MNQNNNSMTKNQLNKSSDEIDLMDLVVQLWRGKWLVLSFAVAAIIIAIIYIFVAKEKWTSEAIVTYPDSGQIADYNNAMSVLYGQNPSNAPTVVDVQQRFFWSF